MAPARISAVSSRKHIIEACENSLRRSMSTISSLSKPRYDSKTPIEKHSMPGFARPLSKVRYLGQQHGCLAFSKPVYG